LAFRTSSYDLKYRFSRGWGSPLSHVSVSIGFDTPKRWTTLTLDCIAELQEKPSSLLGRLLWRLQGKRRYEFSRSVTIVDATEYFQPKPKSTDTIADKTDG
jgi:hypothetical protein